MIGTTLVLTLALRVASLSIPTMHLWGLNVGRFVDPLPAWLGIGFIVATLAPPVARPCVPALEKLGRLDRGATLLWAFAAALVAMLFPDRVRFVGDFLLRQGTVEMQASPGVLFPQALPLDVLIHVTLPGAFARLGWLDAGESGRLIGAIAAAALGAAAAALPRALSLSGAASAAASALVLFGGYLGLFTGYSKSFVELCPIAAWTGVLALRVTREGRGTLALGLVVATGLALHRSALGLLPAAILALGTWVYRHRDARRGEKLQALAGIAVPLVVLMAVLPKLLFLFQRVDLTTHLAPASGMDAAGIRALDLLNLVLLLSPAALSALVAAPFARSALTPRDAALPLVTLVVPFAAAALWVQPAQGVARDWDDFAAGGVALSLVAAWIVGALLRAAPRSAWVSASVTGSVIGATLLWLAHHGDIDRGMDRAYALAREAPARAPRETGTTWEYLGIRNLRLGRPEPAAEAYAQAAERMPSPRILMQWAYAETQAGHLDQAQRVYQRLLRGTPQDLVGWRALIDVAMRRGDRAEARRAAGELLRVRPGDAYAERALDSLRER